MPTYNNKDDRHAFTLYGKRETYVGFRQIPPPPHIATQRHKEILSECRSHRASPSLSNLRAFLAGIVDSNAQPAFGLYSEPRKCRGNNSVTRSKGWAARAPSSSPLPWLKAKTTGRWGDPYGLNSASAGVFLKSSSWSVDEPRVRALTTEEVQKVPSVHDGLSVRRYILLYLVCRSHHTYGVGTDKVVGMESQSKVAFYGFGDLSGPSVRLRFMATWKVTCSIRQCYFRLLTYGESFGERTVNKLPPS